MDTWLIQIGETLPIKPGIRKLRTAYLAEELTQRGHSVFWWASTFDHLTKKWLYQQDTELTLNNLFKIKMLKGLGYKKNISLSRFLDHRLIARRFKNASLSSNRPDIIIISLPTHDLAFEAASYGARYNIPIVVDIRDPWPDIFLDHIPFLPKKLLRVLLHKDFVMVKKTMEYATGITSMMTRFLDWGLGYAGRERTWRDKVFYLGYKRDRGIEQHSKKIDNILQNLQDKFIVTFIGTFAEYHNPSILVECAAKLRNNRNIHFILAGDGQLMPIIRKKSSYLPNITLTGWLEQDDINILLTFSDIGVCTTNQRAYFFPNKAFAYFSAGIPVISAFQGDLRKIIEDYKVGFQYAPNNVNQLINCIQKLANEPELYKELSENAIQLFNEKFDAEKIYKEYADHIESIAKTNSN